VAVVAYCFPKFHWSGDGTEKPSSLKPV
jgi:hypothetical protein